MISKSKQNLLDNLVQIIKKRKRKRKKKDKKGIIEFLNRAHNQINFESNKPTTEIKDRMLNVGYECGLITLYH